MWWSGRGEIAGGGRRRCCAKRNMDMMRRGVGVEEGVVEEHECGMGAAGALEWEKCVETERTDFFRDADFVENKVQRNSLS